MIDVPGVSAGFTIAATAKAAALAVAAVNAASVATEIRDGTYKGNRRITTQVHDTVSGGWV